ncbi:ABC transporter permease subunit [Myxococcota bacterium]|nr:ABC transporter permease subunit [Myxococcota bacterium]MBU1430460.1 ABC transporter permease subunit [Myxococcota bacterium]MBU1898669.1 ABC transporter permease subunit [Myxococcota bacterium]
MSARRGVQDLIHDVGYRGFKRQTRDVKAIWPIARTLFALAWRKRVTKLALLPCFGIITVYGISIVGQLFATEHFTKMGAMSTHQLSQLVGKTQEMLSSFIRTQFFMVALAQAAVAAGAVAEDRRAGALELYFARPLSRLDYALGKLLGAALVPIGALMAPTLLFWIIAVGVTTPALREGLWGLLLPAMGSATLAALLLTTTIVGLSAMSTRATSVGVVYVGGLALLSGLSEGLFQAGQHWAGYLSPERDLRTLIDALLEIGAPSLAAQLIPSRGVVNPSVTWSLLSIAAFIFAGLLALAYRLNREVIDA